MNNIVPLAPEDQVDQQELVTTHIMLLVGNSFFLCEVHR